MNIVSKFSKNVNDVEDNLSNEIGLLQEYKTRLISDVVTGQIDVRNIAVPEYEYVEENSDADSDSADESTQPADEEVS